jgi:hypothetical protein
MLSIRQNDTTCRVSVISELYRFLRELFYLRAINCNYSISMYGRLWYIHIVFMIIRAFYVTSMSFLIKQFEWIHLIVVELTYD